jgi:histidinol dehydrogenase
VTNSTRVGEETIQYVEELLKVLPTAPVASVSWKAFGEVIVTDNMEEAYNIVNELASEHVEILTKSPRDALKQLTNYGALFLGENTCVSYGDKVCKMDRYSKSEIADHGPQCIGTNHVLPTGKAARYTGGLWVGKYLRTTTYQEVKNPEASGKLGQLCGRASRAELFEGHARSGNLRAAKHLGDKYEWIEQTQGAKSGKVNGTA